MRAAATPEQLKAMIAQGVQSFPLTDFDAEDRFDPAASARRLEWLAHYKVTAFFAAGGAGEFFSLTPAEYADVIRTAVGTCAGRIAVIAAVGYGTRTAIDYARQAEALGADGLLLLPPYLTETSQEGLRGHIAAICRATRLGVIIYGRANCRPAPDTLARLAEECPNLIGFKDGIGEIDQLLAIRCALGDRLAYINGMPTAEIYAQAYNAMGVPAYSSAVFNFIPRSALAFHRAVMQGDRATIDGLLRRFFLPYLRIRNRQPGYAVSIVKAGAAIVGHSAGKVRTPLSALTRDEYDQLAALIEGLGPQD